MTTHAIQAFPLQKRPTEQDPFRAGIEMQVGGKPLMVAPYSEGALSVVALINPVLPVVWHPLIVAPAGMNFEMLIGRKVGPFVGFGLIDGSAAFVFQELPWPGTVLEAGETVGVA